MTDDEQKARLIQGLVGDRNYRLYETSAEFHAAIEQLALWLPMMVDGIAHTCAMRQDWTAEQVERLLSSPLGTKVPPVPFPSLVAGQEGER